MTCVYCEKVREHGLIKRNGITSEKELKNKEENRSVYSGEAKVKECRAMSLAVGAGERNSWGTLNFRLSVFSKARGDIYGILCLLVNTSLSLQMNPAHLIRPDLCCFFSVFFLILQAKLIVSTSVVALATLDYNDLFAPLQTLGLWAGICLPSRVPGSCVVLNKRQ